MSYLDRLLALESQKRGTPLPTKPTEGAFVGSVGTHPPHFQNTEAPERPVSIEPVSLPEVKELARLVEIACTEFGEDDRDEALRLALADPETATATYRYLLGDISPKAEARRKAVLAALAKDSTLQRAAVIDPDAEPGNVVLTLAIRDRGTVEVRIPRGRYDPFLLLELIQKHSGTLH